jgi:hypothetical protein
VGGYWVLCFNDIVWGERRGEERRREEGSWEGDGEYARELF